MPCITWPIQGRYADASVDQHCAYPCQLRSRSRTPMVHLHAHRIISDDSCHLTLAFQLLQKRNANLSCAMIADHLIALHSYRISERTGRMFLESDTCFLLFQRFYRISDPGCLHQKIRGFVHSLCSRHFCSRICHYRRHILFQNRNFFFGFRTGTELGILYHQCGHAHLRGIFHDNESFCRREREMGKLHTRYIHPQLWHLFGTHYGTEYPVPVSESIV